MHLIATGFLIKLMVFLYFLASIFSLLLYKHHKAANNLCNSLCVGASLVGIVGSMIHIVSRAPEITLVNYVLSLPYIAINIKIDNLSAFFVLALSVLTLCVSIFSFGYISHYYEKRNVGLFGFLYASFILSMFFVLTVRNAAIFFVVWEMMSLLSFFLVAFEDEYEENQRASILYIIMMHIGTGFLLIAFMMMFSYNGSFDMDRNTVLIPGFAKDIMFVLFFIGFGTKAGIIPFHIWLPYAHPAAPSNISALMSGIMIKTAIYGMIRFIFCYLNIQHTWWGTLILVVGVISCVLGVAYALMEHNIKRLLAFHSIENIGIISIGLGVSFIAMAQRNYTLCALALVAALFHTFNHTLFKGGLFLGAGAIQYSTNTKDIEKLGGLIHKIPIASLFFLCFSLAISAIVPFNGFVSEWLTYQSLLANIHSGQSVINIMSMLAVAGLAMAGAMAAACFIKLFGIAFLGRPRTAFAINTEKLPISMNLGMGILAVLCFFIGVLPMLFLRIVDAVVYGLIGHGVLPQMEGGVFIAYYPLHISGNTINSLIILAFLLLAIIVSILLVRQLGGKERSRKIGTWDCGFEGLNARMQYTATGFSKPLRIVFKNLYRPSRKLKLAKGQSIYFPNALEYTLNTVSIFEKYIYRPSLKAARNLSGFTKLTIQTGSINLYLLYILLTILTLMLYNNFS